MNVAGLYTVEDLRRQAHRRLPRIISDFIEGGAGDEVTIARNRAAYAQITLEPRYMRDVSTRDLSTTILGRSVSTPIMLGPTGLQRLAHRDGELGVAAAASQVDAIYVMSIASSFEIEEIAAASGGPMWFQLYLWSDRVVLERLIERAKAVGCHALCLTVDTPIVGQRDRDLRNGLQVPPRVNLRNAVDAARHPAWLYDLARGSEMTFVNLRDVARRAGSERLPIISYVNQELTNPSATWDDVRWLRELWDGPLVVKGLLAPDDARLAVQAGVDGVVVSNHGGRQIDWVPATIERLPAIVEAVGDQVEVFIDGGIRRGGDVVKALALGARGCLVGRPYWYGLAAAGRAGVERCLEILNAETSATMALIGRPAIADIDRSAVTVPSGWHQPADGIVAL